ncbi:hypothetical protein OM363_09060 [Escherichia albertii]|uniref:hypothetical protein n=1 Tax=Escherichia albertii TaxID=208962 RepID=UPI0002BBFEB4|nr:hypothetical protein [Escherichia albertii]EFX6075754.1 hypothetical protein [Shigella boydii]MCZ8624705.1 hypothetical protein [Escherichia albertii]MCZ8765622.1 hypothetical protein [Escherichia albertii]MCZ8870209.1 hypothetical protein [Escherichia albertii]MCZ8891901.1 hypothetical protein [Escherichia albertii]
MIRYSGVFLSLLMLSGCATEALRNEQAESVITAGNRAVAANASFFKQYYASRENFLVNFYATNPDCAPRPDYETIIENNVNKESLCLQSEKGAKASHKDINKIRLVVTEKQKLLASLEIINSMSAYVELLTENMDVKDSEQIILLNQALDHANNAQKLLGFSENEELTKSAVAVKDLVQYFNGLYKEKIKAENIGKTVSSDWPRLQKNLQNLLDDIATKQQQMKWQTFATISDNFYYYNKSQKNMKNTEFNTLKNRQEFLSAVISLNESRLRSTEPAVPAIQAINAFMDKGNHLQDLYSNKSLSKADLKRKNEILRAQVISGLQASEELAKLIIASGVML